MYAPDEERLADAETERIRAAGHPVVVWTVNDGERMASLLLAGVDGIISDRPDLLVPAVRAHDADGDGRGGDLIGADGLIDGARFQAQGHRGARDLRPENTLPAIEAALDQLVTTIEIDCGVTRDGVAVLGHDPVLDPAKVRRVDGAPLSPGRRIRDLTRDELQANYRADGLCRDATQRNDVALSPVARAFSDAGRIAHPYAMPTLGQVFAFVRAYADHYRSGPGASEPAAAHRARNADRVRFSIEAKVGPAAQPAWLFAAALGAAIRRHGDATRCDIESFDPAPLLLMQWSHPQVRAVYLHGDDHGP